VRPRLTRFACGRLALPYPFRSVHAHLAFPSTRWGLLAEASRGESAEALSEFSNRYYAAVRAFIAAITREPQEADDLTQRFFETAVLTGRVLMHADRRKGHFRPYLKQTIRNFVVDERRRHARSIQSDVRPDTLDDGWDGIAMAWRPGPDAALLRAWAQSLVAMAVARLEAHCEAHGQREHFQLFARRYLTDPDRLPGWRQVGEAFGIDEKTARSRAETAARHFRAQLRHLVASDIGSEHDTDAELQALIALL
jgi:RNA polymerase sigma factor (sigma-70 family)